MRSRKCLTFARAAGVAALLSLQPLALNAADVPNWPNWRGPFQDGKSPERFGDEGGKLAEEPLWTLDVSGGGTPVVFDGRVFDFGYSGEGQDTAELLTALDIKTGEVIWQEELRDYLSDTAYNRYAIGAPTIDPETKNVYLMTSHGLFRCYSFDGEMQWQISMMERFGRLTFPNGRSGSPVIEGDLVIVNGIIAYWGALGPARDRMCAFDKRTGDLVWISTPGVGPQDSSFSTPVSETRDGRRVLYAGTGCGNVVAVNARNGDPLWRFQMSHGGVNSSPVVYKDTVICVHGKENVDTSEEGRMVAIKIPTIDAANPSGEPLVLPADAEVWRNPLNMFTSSPVLVGDRVYQLTKTGELACVDAETGKILWEEKLGASNLHASPLYADGLLYVPQLDGTLYVIKPSDEGPETVQTIELEGNCLGAPAIWNGHLLVHTKEKLYCFKIEHTEITADPIPQPQIPEAGEPVALQIVPVDFLLNQGDSQSFRVRKVDANGLVTGEIPAAEVEWAEFVPPTAKVKATVDGSFNEEGDLVIAGDADTSAGAFKGTSGGLAGIVRGRTLPALPYTEDFEGFALDETDAGAGAFAYPPLPWIGARFKFDIREVDGNKLFAKNLDRLLFQRASTFIGDPDLSAYTLQADVMTEGNRRKKMDVGLINQRYLIVLQGNYNQIEISSNQERLKVAHPFPIKANTWYTLKTRVDTKGDGSGTVHVKAWERDADEPAEWTFSHPMDKAHLNGAPGIYGFALQNQLRVFVDNIKITPNES